MLDWIVNTIATSGYIGILLLMLLENLLPPIPSELIMPLAGFVVNQGKLNFAAVILAGTLGSLLGAIPWYWLGRRVGETRLRQWLERYGKWLTLSGQDLDRSKRWFSQYGGAVVFFGRLIPGIRTYISIPAGLQSMPLPFFLLYSTLGTAIWTGLLTYAGYLLGHNYQQVKQFLGPVAQIVAIALLLLVSIWFIRRRHHQQNSTRVDPTQP